MEFTKNLDLQYLTNPAEMQRLVKPAAKEVKPVLDGIKPVRTLNRVVLPAPLGPINPRIFPFSKEQEKSTRALTPLKCLFRLSISSQLSIIS